MLTNTTLVNHSSSASSSVIPPVRTRTVVNAIYIAGIAFMIGVFLLLLWVNLCSQNCRCWHDTSLVRRLNERWLRRRSLNRASGQPIGKAQRQRSSIDDDLA